jgi:hypothetical protein
LENISDLKKNYKHPDKTGQSIQLREQLRINPPPSPLQKSGNFNSPPLEGLREESPDSLLIETFLMKGFKPKFWSKVNIFEDVRN